jgi:hypothetical protein
VISKRARAARPGIRATLVSQLTTEDDRDFDMQAMQVKYKWLK